MRRILTPIVLLTFLFPSFAYGDGLICKVTGWNCPEVDWSDLVERESLYYKKFTKVPFTGKTTGKRQGLMKDGKKVGPWVFYHDNGQLQSKETFKDGKRDGPSENYHENGQLWSEGTFKDDKSEGPWVDLAPLTGSMR